MIENNIRYLGYPIEEIEIDENNILLTTLDTLYKSILNSSEYKSLEGKTQLLNIGVDDKVLGLTTRMIHDIHVSQNAMKMAKKLNLNPEQILKAQIMGISHDLGMPPFGHDGENALNEVLNEFDRNYRFSHSEYGTEVLEKIIEKLREGKEADIYENYDEKYIESIKEELKEGVKRHSIYYSYQAKGETIEQKCVRFADTLSFMASDLSDIIRASSKGIIQYEISEEELERQLYETANESQKEEIKEIIEGLKEGGDKLEKIHNKLIKEAFSQKRNSVETCVIIDDYKKLREIKNKYKLLKEAKNDTTITEKELIKQKGEVLQSIKEYYEYLIENKERAIPNKKLMEILDEKVGEESHEERLDKFKGIANLMMNYGIDEEIGESLLADESLEKSINEQTERIQKRELGDCPTLMSIFMLQDKIVYEDILGNKEDILKNEPDKVKENISKMFKSIVNLSYIATKKPEYLKEDRKPNLNLYNGEKVPDLENCDNQIIKYATYAVQQMKNEDFLNEKKLQKIAEELGIAEEKIHEILEMDTEEIFARIKNEKEREKFLEKVSKTKVTSSIKEKNEVEEKEEKSTNPLEYTKEEKNAIKIYEGTRPGESPLSSDEKAYDTINVMLFKGIENENVRVLEEHKRLIPEAILHPEELLEVATNLYSAMYKYGKKMNNEQKTFRIDRMATIEEMEKTKEIPSHFSTSKNNDFKNNFKKKEQVIEEVYIEPNVICVDFKDILDSDYSFYEEEEILVAPGNEVKIEKEDITEEEKKLKTLDRKDTKYKYKITITPPPKAKPLNDEEKKDKEEAMKIFTDTKYRKQAATYLFDLMQFTSLKNPKNIDEEIDISEKEAYLKFKEAFQKIYEYETREIALNIEKQLKEKELHELTTEREFKQMEKIAQGIMKITNERTEERKLK